MTDADESLPPTRRAGRPGPPAQSAKVVTAGVSASALLGLVALVGWTDTPPARCSSRRWR